MHLLERVRFPCVRGSCGRELLILTTLVHEPRLASTQHTTLRALDAHLSRQTSPCRGRIEVHQVPHLNRDETAVTVSIPVPIA